MKKRGKKVTSCLKHYKPTPRVTCQFLTKHDSVVSALCLFPQTNFSELGWTLREDNT